LIFYNFNRRHGSLRRELKIRTPFEAVQSWFQTKPEIFKILLDVFYDIAFGKQVQCCETGHYKNRQIVIFKKPTLFRV